MSWVIPSRSAVCYWSLLWVSLGRKTLNLDESLMLVQSVGLFEWRGR